MKTYARIQDGVVVELLVTDLDITARFNPALIWVDVSKIAGIQPGWQQTPDGFAKPTPPPAPALPNLAQLQTQLASISTQLATLSKAT